jgi:hypothetical protein
MGIHPRTISGPWLPWLLVRKPEQKLPEDHPHFIPMMFPLFFWFKPHFGWLNQSNHLNPARKLELAKSSSIPSRNFWDIQHKKNMRFNGKHI